jgi:hypothetical protein
MGIRSCITVRLMWRFVELLSLWACVLYACLVVSFLRYSRSGGLNSRKILGGLEFCVVSRCGARSCGEKKVQNI